MTNLINIPGFFYHKNANLHRFKLMHPVEGKHDVMSFYFKSSVFYKTFLVCWIMLQYFLYSTNLRGSRHKQILMINTAFLGSIIRQHKWKHGIHHLKSSCLRHCDNLVLFFFCLPSWSPTLFYNFTFLGQTQFMCEFDK